MPESATLEASEITTSTDPIPGAEMPEGLRNLLDRVLPSESGSDTGETVVEEQTEETETPPEKAPTAIRVVPEKKPEPVRDSAESRLAPDLSGEKKEDTPPVPEEFAANLKELDTAIQEAKSPKQKADMKKFRDLLARTQEEVVTLKARPPATEEDAGTKELLAKLQEENKTLIAKVERVDLLASPRFQQQFVQPRNKMFADAVSLLKEAEVEPDQLERAMGLSGKARIAVLDELTKSIDSPILRDRFGRLIDGIETKNQEIGEALKNARANSETLSRQEKIERHQAIENQEKEMRTMLAMARRDLAENAKIPVLQKTGDPKYAWWDKTVDDVDALAEHFMLRATPDMIGKIAYGAAMVDPLLDMFNSERKARLAAEKRLAAIEGADPGLGEDKRKPKDEGDVPEDADIKTAVFARLKGGR